MADSKDMVGGVRVSVGGGGGGGSLFSALRGSLSESYFSDVVVIGVELRVVECISGQAVTAPRPASPKWYLLFRCQCHRAVKVALHCV